MFIPKFGKQDVDDISEEGERFSKGDDMRQQWLLNLNITKTKTYFKSMPVVSCAHNQEALGLHTPADYGFIERKSGMRGKADILRT